MSAIIASTAVTTGRFIWRDVMTTNPEKAKAFYGELFGWTTTAHDIGGGMVYETLKNGDQEFGGIMALDPAHGAPSHWISYIDVPSVDDAVASAKRNGGTVAEEPMDIPNVGRFAVVGDPQGTYFSPMTPIPMENADGADCSTPEMPPLGGVTWNELITGDLDGAKAFYGDIFGWRFEQMNMVEGQATYYVAKHGDRMDCGMMAKPSELPVSLWVIYYHVADIEHSLTEVSRLGGQQASPIIDVPTIGRMAWVTDPTGALFALHQEPK